VRSVVMISLLAIACGNKGTGPTGPTNGSNGVAAPDGKLPTGAPLVTPGERMSYKVSLKGIELAAYTLTVDNKVTDVDGKQAIAVQGSAKLVGLAQWFSGKVDDKFTSFIDVNTGRSLRFVVEEYGSRSSDVEHTTVELGKRAENIVPVMFHMNQDEPKPEPQKVSQPETWDYNTFLVLMRSWEGPPGTKHTMEVFRSRNLWKLDVTIKGKTKLKTELGELPALAITAHLVKLDRDLSKFPDTDERDFTLWISDDAGRVPLRVDAGTDYGDIKMEIVEYVAGNGEPLRK
jgi:hypothetical protein